jgi:ribA/ribD-fused uncharacterized protein
MINNFHGEYEFLSNFYPDNIKALGMTFTSLEHAYQASKSESRSDWDKIAACETPGQAKRRGQDLMMRPSWDHAKLAVMENLLRQKFRPGTALAEKLMNTLPHRLEEGNTWGDTFWGTVNGVGSNHLGRLLMEIREDLIDGVNDGR